MFQQKSSKSLEIGLCSAIQTESSLPLKILGHSAEGCNREYDKF
jgi:hypothetical protein